MGHTRLGTIPKTQQWRDIVGLFTGTTLPGAMTSRANVAAIAALDSLAGAVQTAKRGQNSVLVSHRPVSTMSARQRKLFKELEKSFRHRFVHIPVWINKDEGLGYEPTQRTRSFLFAALGTAVGESINAGGVRFFENGVVSLNLPVADEVLRSRASRTTHPIVLQRLQLLCSAIAKRDFSVDNPYFFKTKTEVVETLASCGVPHLIGHTCSCAHSMFKSKTRWHCGKCSQCIDRRFGVIAAGVQEYDREDDYESDVFVGARAEGPEKNIAADYVRHGSELCQRSEQELMSQFSAELSRAVRYEPKRTEAATKIVRMHQRHGKAVACVLEKVIVERAADLANGTLPPTSLLAMFVRKDYLGCPASSGITTADVQKIAMAIVSQMGAPVRKKSRSRKEPDRRNTVIYAAIMLEFRGPQYCDYLDSHGLRPKWRDSGPNTYRKSYDAGHPWRKKIQDEKSRAGARLKAYPESEARNALVAHLPDEFAAITEHLNSRNSRNASSKPLMFAQA